MTCGLMVDLILTEAALETGRQVARQMLVLAVSVRAGNDLVRCDQLRSRGQNAGVHDPNQSFFKSSPVCFQYMRAASLHLCFT